MPFKEPFSLVVLGLWLSVFAFAQTPATQTESPTAAKDAQEKARLELEQKAFALAERVAADAVTLKLPENRAFALATTADLLWEQDQKRARSLFRSAAEEIILANAASAKDASGDSFSFFDGSPRPAILQMIAKHDPDLALELLATTRDPRVVAEMQKAALPAAPVSAADKDKTENNSFVGPLKWQARAELQLEYHLATVAAANNPTKAAKMIRETMTTRGVSPELLNTVKKLHQKDAELGNQVLEEIVSKTLAADFSKRDAPENQTAFTILRQYVQTTSAANVDSKKQPLKVEDKMLRDLANKVADTMLKAISFTELWQFSLVLPMIEKIVPERAAALKQKQAALKKTAPEGMFSFDSWGLLSEPDADPEKLLEAANKVPAGITGMRGQFYRRAVDKFAEKGDLERARQLISAMPDGKERDDALAEIDAKSAEKAIKDDKFDEARKLVGKIGNKSKQIEQFVRLALAFYNKNDKESRQAALKLMEEAKSLTDLTPQDDEEIEALVQIISGYVVIDSPRAFDLLEPLVDQSNDLLQAAALVSKYKKRDSNNFNTDQDVFHNGELVINILLRRMRNQLHFKREIGLLATADFARLRDLSDKFRRTDAQILVRLIIAQSILQKEAEDNKTAANADDDENYF